MSDYHLNRVDCEKEQGEKAKDLMGRPEPASDGLQEREGHLALPGEGEQPGHRQAEIKNLEATVKKEVTKKGKNK